MIELVKWTLGLITIVMTYILMVEVTANASATPYAMIMVQLGM